MNNPYSATTAAASPGEQQDTRRDPPASASPRTVLPLTRITHTIIPHLRLIQLGAPVRLSISVVPLLYFFHLLPIDRLLLSPYSA